MIKELERSQESFQPELPLIVEVLDNLNQTIFHFWVTGAHYLPGDFNERN